jgi:stress response protein YsnF
MVKDSGISSSPHVRPAAEETADDPTLSLAAEAVSIKKEAHEIGRVRVATRTYERETLIEEDLARERVEIESVPVGRQIDNVPEVRQQGDITIVPVVEEVLFIERRLMLKEEIHIRRVRTTEHHQDKVMLRHQEPVVSRSQYEPGEPAATSAVGPGRAKPEAE